MQNTFLNDMLPLGVTEMQQFQNGARKLDWHQESLTARYVRILTQVYMHVQVCIFTT